MLSYSLLATVSAISTQIGAVFRGECDIGRTVAPFAKNRTHNHCVRITVLKIAEFDPVWKSWRCGEYRAQHGISKVLTAKGCRRYSAAGAYMKPPQDKRKKARLNYGEILECHCSGDATPCGLTFSSGIMKALDDSSNSLLIEDIGCLKPQVKRQLPQLVTVVPPRTPARTRTRKPATREKQTTKQTTKELTTTVPTTAKIVSQQSDQMKPDTVTEVTEDELVRKVSLHLLMFSTVMSTLMVCQLALLTKLRNLYRYPSSQPSKKKKSKKEKAKSKSPATKSTSTKSQSSSAPSSPTKDYFKP